MLLDGVFDELPAEIASAVWASAVLGHLQAKTVVVSTANSGWSVPPQTPNLSSEAPHYPKPRII